MLLRQVSLAALARMTQRRQEMVWIYAVDGVAATLDVPTLGDIPEHAHHHPLDENVRALARRWIAVVQTWITMIIGVSSPNPARKKCTAKNVRFHQHKPLA